MRICIPTETNIGADSRVGDHFGGSPFYVVVDTETARIEVVSGGGYRSGGSPDHHVGQMTALGVQAVACRGMGRRAYAAMRAAGIDVLRTEHDTVSEVLEAACNGRLSRLSQDEACGGGRHRRGRHPRGVPDDPDRWHRPGYGWTPE